MPEADGRITLRLDENEAQVLFWALIGRIRQCGEDRRTAELTEQQMLENEIIQLGALLEKLPTYKKDAH
jgi:hypothetical protein